MNFGLKNKIFGDEDVARFQEQFNSDEVILVDAVGNMFEGLDIWHFNAFSLLGSKDMNEAIVWNNWFGSVVFSDPINPDDPHHVESFHSILFDDWIKGWWGNSNIHDNRTIRNSNNGEGYDANITPNSFLYYAKLAYISVHCPAQLDTLKKNLSGYPTVDYMVNKLKNFIFLF